MRSAPAIDKYVLRVGVREVGTYHAECPEQAARDAVELGRASRLDTVDVYRQFTYGGTIMMVKLAAPHAARR
jgi:hypothetical protein